MNIIEALSGYGPDEKVKIGCVDGEAYWWAGRVKDVDPVELNAKLLQSLQNGVETSKKKLKNHLYRSSPPELYLKKELEQNEPKPTAQKYMEELQLYFAAGVRIKATLEKRKLAVAEYKPIVEREVKECEPSDPGADDCIRVLLEGRENGKLWMTDEAKTLPGFFLPGKEEDE